MRSRSWSAFAFAFLVLLTSLCAYAGPLTLTVGADDYSTLYIDGILLGTIDTYPGGSFSKAVDLTTGWHSIAIDYMNRWGSNGLGVYWQFPADSTASVIPLADFRSNDQAGNPVSGLKADYFSLDGTPPLTVYGEGPIQHGATWYGSTLGVAYEGQPGLWAGQFGPWDLFEEKLNGEIFIPAAAVPEPGSFSLLGTLLGALGGSFLLRRRRGRKTAK
jgi:hypothetical protein